MPSSSTSSESVPLALSLAVFALVFVASCESTVSASSLWREPLLQRYDPAFALSTAYMAASSYCDASVLRPFNCSACMKIKGEIRDVEPFIHTSWKDSTFGYTAFDDKYQRIIVAFRGSDDIRDWIGNIDAFKTAFLNDPSIQVHRGFYNDYMSVRDTVVPAILEFRRQFKNAPIIIVGHSLGGAIATLCAADLALTNGISEISLVTFGAPRVGDESFASFFENKLNTQNAWRIVHYKDLVPSVPPKSFGFRHVGIEVLYNEDFTNYSVCPLGESDPACQITSISIQDHLSYFNFPISGDC